MTLIPLSSGKKIARANQPGREEKTRLGHREKANAPIIPFASRGSAIDILEEYPEPPSPPPISVHHSSVNCRSDLPRTSGCRCNCRAQDKVECYGGRQAINGRHGTERTTRREREKDRQTETERGGRKGGGGKVDDEMERRQLSLSRRVSRG